MANLNATRAGFGIDFSLELSEGSLPNAWHLDDFGHIGDQKWVLREYEKR